MNITFPTKPCPFCGSSLNRIDQYMYYSSYQVRCDKCDAHGPDGRTPNEAIELWNQAPRPAVLKCHCDAECWHHAVDDDPCGGKINVSEDYPGVYIHYCDKHCHPEDTK